MQPPELVGAWSIERTLHDRRAGLQGRFHGTLQVRRVGPTGDEYSWDESGTLVWNKRSVSAGRQLALHRRDGQWWMTFADGRPFHPWTIGAPVRHPCVDDTYLGLIEVAGPSELAITWQVTGPEKDQLITSRLHRLG